MDAWCIENGSAGNRRVENKGDRGSGTLLGVGLVLVLSLFLGSISVLGKVIVTQSKAQTASDLSALAGASAFSGAMAASSPCSVVEVVATKNSAQVESCVSIGSDVVVEVSVASGVPLYPKISSRSKAGPASCGDSSEKERNTALGAQRLLLFVRR